jgi:hypothetical protein
MAVDQVVVRGMALSGPSDLRRSDAMPRLSWYVRTGLAAEWGLETFTRFRGRTMAQEIWLKVLVTYMEGIQNCILPYRVTK